MTTTSTTTNENNRQKPTLAQTIDQVMTIKTHTESSKTELSSGGKRPFKVWRFFFKFNFFPPMEGIFFSRRTVGSFFVTHATEGAAYITSAHDNSDVIWPLNIMMRRNKLVDFHFTEMKNPRSGNNVYAHICSFQSPTIYIIPTQSGSAKWMVAR